jgi:putative SOS response-associated peptidase YedK
LALFHWRLIPSWAKDAKIASSLINARSETLAEKPSFRTAFARRRCLPFCGLWASVPHDRA